MNRLAGVVFAVALVSCASAWVVPHKHTHHRALMQEVAEHLQVIPPSSELGLGRYKGEELMLDIHGPHHMRHHRHGFEEDAAGDLMMALDCGSSGTKFLLYAKTGKCPNPAGFPKQCGSLKIEPTMSSPLAVYPKYATYPWHLVQQLGATEFKGYIAMATAGNRIIADTVDTDAWNKLTTNMANPVGIAAAGAGSWAPSTIPGTMEAWLEYEATKAASGDSGNFFSLGGSSAQMAFELTNPATVAAWTSKIGNLRVTACNSQSHLADYACVHRLNANHFECIAPGEVQATCGAGGRCVALFSILAGMPSDEQAGCPDTDAYHTVGGTTESAKYWKMYVDTFSKLPGLKAGQSCSAAMAELDTFIVRDPQMAWLKSFVTAYKAADSNAKWYRAGNMALAKTLEDSDSLCDGSDKLKEDLYPPSSGLPTAFFKAWGKAIPGAVGAGSDMDDAPNKIDWMNAAAKLMGFPDLCKVPGYAGECASKIGDLDSDSDL